MDHESTQDELQRAAAQTDQEIIAARAAERAAIAPEDYDPEVPETGIERTVSDPQPIVLPDDPALLDVLAGRVRDRPAPADDYMRAFAHTLVWAAAEYAAILDELAVGDLDAERIEIVRESGSTVSVDLTIRLRSLHRAQEDPDSQHYLTEMTPAERLLGRLAQSFTLLIGLGYRDEVPALLLSAHELRRLMGEPEVARWLIAYTDRTPWIA
jgi:hypothetical protein